MGATITFPSDYTNVRWEEKIRENKYKIVDIWIEENFLWLKVESTLHGYIYTLPSWWNFLGNTYNLVDVELIGPVDQNESTKLLTLKRKLHG